ncbi:IclR family transcriptional regulator [Zhengella mangrovi]|uniref:IclR family transcriptional regulator n=1 Tax=Zhengella mangrovi TaxID=1982044 RepID=A0A2G1QIX7_9HYPH|nr:IclR family transcriptional regulator [Zhengella mangrovi]PHP65410.1 IclR family transcriptional regulator [Zhengella mangrovi]
MEAAAPKRAQSMKTIDKAMKLLNLFTTETPEFRLVDIARASGLDKVTAMRVLNSLASGGLLEQHPETRKYRLGTAILRLARIRETSFPMISTLQPIVDRLSEETGESGHASLASDAGLTTIALCEPNRSTRVWIDPTQVLPFHATASGIVYLAHLPPEEAASLLALTSDRRYTDETASGDELRRRIQEARKLGYARSFGGFEVDTAGFAAPVFDWHGKVIATMGLACVRSRLDEANDGHLIKAVVSAASAATRAFGGRSPGNAPVAV